MPTQVPPRSLRLPVLLDQQFWFLGHDIRHAAGNALERFGFTRWRHPQRVGTSCYVLPQGAGEALVCWGFAAYLGAVRLPDTSPLSSGDESTGPAGILVQRHSMTPRLVLAPPTLPVHRLADLPRTRAPRSRRDWDEIQRRLPVLAALFAGYEQWAHGALGASYRLETLRALPRHKRRKFELVANLSAQWECWHHRTSVATVC